MNTFLTLIITCIILLFVLFLLLYFFRERVEVDGDTLFIRTILKQKKIVLDHELVSWKVQEAYYLRMGMVYSINMLLKNGSRLGVSSRFNLENYERLLDHLSKHYSHRRNLKDV